MPGPLPRRLKQTAPKQHRKSRISFEHAFRVHDSYRISLSSTTGFCRPPGLLFPRKETNDEANYMWRGAEHLPRRCAYTGGGVSRQPRAPRSYEAVQAEIQERGSRSQVSEIASAERTNRTSLQGTGRVREACAQIAAVNQPGSPDTPPDQHYRRLSRSTRGGRGMNPVQ